MTQIKQSRRIDVGLADVQDNRGQTQNFLLSVTSSFLLERRHSSSYPYRRLILSTSDFDLLVFLLIKSNSVMFPAMQQYLTATRVAHIREE